MPNKKSRSTKTLSGKKRKARSRSARDAGRAPKRAALSEKEKVAVKRIAKKQAETSQICEGRFNLDALLTGTIGTDTYNDITTQTANQVEAMFEATNPVMDGNTITYSDLTQSSGKAEMVRAEFRWELANLQGYPAQFEAILFQCKRDTNESAKEQLKKRLNDYAIDSSEAKITSSETNPLFRLDDVAHKLSDWRVVKKWNFVLNPTQSKTLLGYGKKVMTNIKGSLEQGEQRTYLKGWALHMVYKARGGLVCDTTSRSEINYGPFEVASIASLKVKFRFHGPADGGVRTASIQASALGTVAAARTLIHDVEVVNTNPIS